MKIWIVDSACYDKRSVCDTDGAWSYHKSKEGAMKRLAELEADPSYSNYMFEVCEAELED